MAERMTHEQYVAIIRQQILEAAEGILNNNIDIIAACHFMWQYWREAEFSESTQEYLFLTGFDDEIEIFNPDQRELHQTEIINDKEKELLEYYHDQIITVCTKIVQFSNR